MIDIKKFENELSRLMTQYSDNKKQLLHRVEIKLDKIDLLQWLNCQQINYKVYWQSKNCNFEMAGIGCALKYDKESDYNFLDEIKNGLPPEIKCYGGFSFSNDINGEKEWQHFGNELFFVPRFEIIRRGNSFLFACNLNLKEDHSEILKKVNQIDFTYEECHNKLPSLKKRKNEPEYEQWKNQINEVLSLFRQRKFDKIVLSRKTRLFLSSPLSPFEMLNKIKQNSINSTLFGFQLKKGLAFIGASPEILLRIHENQIYSEAIAGTRRRGDNEQDDLDLEKELLESQKDRFEHDFVVQEIFSVLNQFCTDLSANRKTSILKLKRVQHLYNLISGKLMDGYDESKIIEKLHPTPAVGGFPAKKAIREIKKIEQHNRGWYAGPVGWISKNESEFVVAIRSGLIKDDQLLLYSGAGIVNGSLPESEWIETENKIDNFLKILGIDD